MRNCPNCGAPINGDKCEYCGTVFVKDKDRYRFNEAQEEYFQRLNLIDQLNRLEIEHKNLEFHLAFNKFINDTKQLATECCCDGVKFPAPKIVKY